MAAMVRILVQEEPKMSKLQSSFSFFISEEAVAKYCIVLCFWGGGLDLPFISLFPSLPCPYALPLLKSLFRTLTYMISGTSYGSMLEHDGIGGVLVLFKIQDFLSSSLLTRILHIAEPQVHTAGAYVAWCTAVCATQYLRLLGMCYRSDVSHRRSSIDGSGLTRVTR